ncbi:hypothetical protein PIB30_064672 [Stylosanthes scabra]|uniref:Uncharacterized protein n=1 Tax=Stylosanthes scabra TaxID=79078 RepID=A0ABU6TMQ0_9FABA|nr:hypothetical protein [Stylosanthes scabra]
MWPMRMPRLWLPPQQIWDGHDCWDQVKKGTTEITNVFKEHYKWYAPLFSHAPDEAIDFWWEEWRKRFRFHRGDEANMRKAWESRAAKRHWGLMHNIREKGAPHDWIPDDIFARYEAFWRSPEYQVMRRANKTNRASSTGGSLHTGGLITYPAIAKKMEAVKAEVKRLEDERDARIVAGLPPGPPIDEDEVWDRMAGGRKKGRIYGKGKVPKRPVPQLVDPEDASTYSGPDAREHITLLNREIHQQAEQHRREMEYWKQRYETDVTRLQNTIDTQSAEFDQWKSHVSQMYAFMQTMQGTTSSVMPPPPPPPSSSLRPPRPPPAAAPSRTETDPDDGSSSDDEDDYE